MDLEIADDNALGLRDAKVGKGFGTSLARKVSILSCGKEAGCARVDGLRRFASRLE